MRTVTANLFRFINAPPGTSYLAVMNIYIIRLRRICL